MTLVMALDGTRGCAHRAHSPSHYHQNVCWDPRIAGLEASPLHDTDPFGALMNGRRTQVAAIVHQYDRCPSLMSRLPFLQRDRSRFELRVGEPSRSVSCTTYLKRDGYREQGGARHCLTQVPREYDADEQTRCAVRYATLKDAAGNCSLHQWCSGVVHDGGLPCSGLHGVPRRAAGGSAASSGKSRAEVSTTSGVPRVKESEAEAALRAENAALLSQLAALRSGRGS